MLAKGIVFFGLLILLDSGSVSADTCRDGFVRCVQSTGDPLTCQPEYRACTGLPPLPAEKSPHAICSDWPSLRDSQEFVDRYNRLTKRFDASIRIQKNWIDRMDEISDYDTGLKIVAALDVSMTVLDVTAQTVRSSIDLATLGAPEKIMNYSSKKVETIMRNLDQLESGADYLASRSVEEDILLVVAKRNALADHARETIQIIQTLVAAKERSIDRFEAMDVVDRAQAGMRTSLALAEEKLAQSKSSFEDFNRVKNDLDDLCTS